MFNWLIRSASREKNDNNPGEVVPIAVVDRAVDTLANVLHTYGDQAFDVNEVSRDELKRRCASWARHVSAGAPAPVGPDEADENYVKHAATLEQRAWADLQLFFLQHRQKERLEVETAGRTMREVLQGMTARLRAAMAETDTSEKRLLEQMRQMEATVRGGSLTHIQKDFRQLQGIVDKVLAERKRHYEGQVATHAWPPSGRGSSRPALLANFAATYPTSTSITGRGCVSRFYPAPRPCRVEVCG